VSGRSVVVVVTVEGSSGALARVLTEPGLTVHLATLAEAEQALAALAPDVVVAELTGQGREATALLHALAERAPDVPLVAASAGAQAGAAQELLRAGAFAVVDREDAVALRCMVARAVEHHGLRREAARLRRELAPGRDRVPLLGRTAVMLAVKQQVDDLAAKSSPAIIMGGPGTGKSWVAREIHERGSRASRPLVVISCVNLHETLLESQIFGHRRGSFAGATHDHDGAARLAAGGTLVIERIELLAGRLQTRLNEMVKHGRYTSLGATQVFETDARVIATTPRDIESLARAGRFRDDLHETLRMGAIRLPALRDRRDDVAFLAEVLAAEESERLGVAARRFDAEALALLLKHSWPANVRELREAVRQGVRRSMGDAIRPEHLPAAVRAGARAGIAREPDRLPTLAEAEAELVGLALEDAEGNKTLAARRLGIDRKRLYRKIRRYGLLGNEPGEEDLDGADDDG